MIEIKRGIHPQCLIEKQVEAKKQGLNSDDAYRLLEKQDKEVILNALMVQQGHLCAYCMRKIPDERVPQEDYKDIHPATIEHWFPRNPKNGTEIGQGLDYNNLLAVCSGGRRKRKNGQPRAKNGELTCDAKRKDSYSQLTLNPCNPDTLSSLYYLDDGKLCSNDPVITDDIEVKLNLNCQKDMMDLPRIREEVLHALQSSIPDDEEAALMYCQKALVAFESETDPKTEYVGILIWWLKKYIESCKIE